WSPCCCGCAPAAGPWSARSADRQRGIPHRAAARRLAGLAGVSTDGLIVVDKPGGMTSHDVVARIRRLARTRRVGHGGTLDPMATGVLVIGVGRATRLLTYVIGAGKSYTAT